MKIKSLAGVIALAAVLLFNTPSPSFAQQAESDDGLDEVVVTARKRDESYRDVPVTISVFTEATIRDAGIQRPADFIALVPNMTLVETQNAGSAFVVVRGVSQARNSEPSVAVLVDGVLETNPAEFNQELFDIQQVEVLKGPQGALYGRNAIGGAIIIRTKDPSDELEGIFKVGIGNGSSKRAQAGISGPIGSSDTFKFRASVNYYDTDGFIPSSFLGGKADPAEDISGRLRFIWKPNETFTGDLRLAASKLETRALYFVIPRLDESNPFTSFFTPPDANDVTTPIRIDNAGQNDRDLYNASLKLDFETSAGTFTSVSAYNKTKEILTGDAYDFRPAASSIFRALLGVDLNQSQFLDVEALSQELRFTSPTEGRFRWIAGAYYVQTDRFISTGNMVDTGTGVFPVYRAPRGGANNPSATFLADSQDNSAWAVFADATFEVNDQFEIDAAVRHDEDTRKNRTETPAGPFLDALLDPTARFGRVRKNTWSETQPKLTLRYKPSEDITIFGGWSRGFRSGGFNQTGVGALARANQPAPILGVNDLFEAEVADTTEIGIKGQFFDRRLSAGLSLYKTESTNGYFFVFLAANSTQNLGNVDADFEGAELELNAKVSDHLSLFASYGYTDSEITGMEDRSVIGNQAPLVSKSTFNAGFQLRYPVSEGLQATFRSDYQRIGRTWWEPYNVTSRDPVSLLDVRVGLEGERWAATAWSKNLNDKLYNAEFSPGGFLFKALPQRYGIEFQYKF
jgi:iron complex outermembrane receptor protein